MEKRASGVLLHITSLPSRYGIGDLGPEAYKFADFLAETKQSFWQILPLNPTITVLGNSPYSSPSAFAGNPFLISPELLVEEGFISESDIETFSSLSERVDYEEVSKYKNRFFRTVFKNLKRDKMPSDYEEFCRDNSHWLDDYALFTAIKENLDNAWTTWHEDIRDRKPEALKGLRLELKDKIEMNKLLQYLFFRQWLSLRSYCNVKGVQIIGDIPIYVSFDSVDVWANPKLFKLDDNKQPVVVAGVPPDYFSKTGQRWGNPVYRWDYLRETGYSWWIKRLEQNFNLYDVVRVDHFRGFVAYWEIPANEKTAINGKWVKAPANHFFDTLLKHFPKLPVIAEDLGHITQDVRDIVRKYEFPNMKLLIFGFGNDFPNGAYLPHNHIKNCVVYTGTHDNNTVQGWFTKEATPEMKARLFKYLKREIEEQEVHWALIELAMSSIADLCLIPMQDVLGLGEDARMNFPATENMNWEWRLNPKHITPQVKERLRSMTQEHGRGGN